MAKNPNLSQQEVFTDLMGHPVEEFAFQGLTQLLGDKRTWGSLQDEVWTCEDKD